eukprot:CAMPEP_0185036850 /NCGR_PEP_ID=MMETSP1103-20130426/30432_1 /TAXON_ID=36769 /ORGANISM="Paraphysomonas bandaiensis, Strain Caron Lab Isolate" /LENGTH=81 /DNA_ID=CAMNT_0027574571 /DNA_START=152 /DNA_END=394 /DNA_ORIENTATION=-
MGDVLTSANKFKVELGVTVRIEGPDIVMEGINTLELTCTVTDDVDEIPRIFVRDRINTYMPSINIVRGTTSHDTLPGVQPN